jgi:hypothetical protein
MSDLGKNLDVNPSFGAGKPGGSNPAKKIDVDIGTPNNQSSGNKQIEIENRGVYKNPSISQAQLGFEAQERLGAENSPKLIDKANDNKKQLDKQSTAGLPKDYELKAKNPTLAAQLQNQKPKVPNKGKKKQAPPEPSLQVQYSPRKGISINPRKVKPSVPGRLQAFFDDPEKPLEKLANALNTDENYDINLAHHYAKRLIKEDAKTVLGLSLAQLLNLDEDFIEFKRDKLIRQLEEQISELKQDPASQDMLASIINTLVKQPDVGLLAPLIQLFMPLPYSFIFAEIDEEFERDEKELQEEQKEEKNSSDQDDKEDEEEEKYDCTTSMSIKTLNYNKLHFNILQDTKSSRVKVYIKGDPSASELVIPIESELEEVVFDDIDDIDYLVSTWHDNVLRITESRVLKVTSTGKLNPLMLKICNAILQGVNNNDIDLSDDDMIEGKFNLI